MSIKHGMHGTNIYNVWLNMKSRCLNPMNYDFQYYGGRGITICKEWLDAGTFCEWALTHGYEEGLSLDRIDNDKGYYPENCRFVTHKEQMRNIRTNRMITYKGETHCMSEWAEITGIPYSVIRSRVKAGWEPEQIFTVPVSRSNTGLNHGKRVYDG